MEDFFVCRQKGVCAVAGYFLICALSLRLPCSMNKIKKKKKKSAPHMPHHWESCASHPGLLLLAPLARWTDQVLHLEAYGTWWRGSWFWFAFTFGFCILCWAHPSLVFAQRPATPGSFQLWWVLFPPARSVSVTTTVKEKTTPNFSPSFFLIG